MSKVKIQGNASGTGTFTISAPNSNTDRSITLPDGAGEILTDASTLSSSNLSGALPAIDGSALTNLPGGGKVLQVQVGYQQDTVNTTTSASHQPTSLYVNITPSSTSSIIYVMFSIVGTTSGANQTVYMYRDGSALNSRPISKGQTNSQGSWASHSGVFKDAPSTTSSVQYRLYHTTGGDTSYIGTNPGIYTITAWEIDGS